MTITHSPWGPVQSQREIAPGLTLVSTASHGGLHMSQLRNQQLKLKLPDFRAWAGMPWLEEDCDICAAPIVWPEFYEPYAIRCAVRFYMRTIDGTNTVPVQRFLKLTVAGRALLAQADSWDAEHGEEWEGAGGCSHSLGWLAFFTRVKDGARRECIFPPGQYPQKQLYTSAELDRLSQPEELATARAPQGWNNTES